MQYPLSSLIAEKSSSKNQNQQSVSIKLHGFFVSVGVLDVTDRWQMAEVLVMVETLTSWNAYQRKSVRLKKLQLMTLKFLISGMKYSG